MKSSRYLSNLVRRWIAAAFLFPALALGGTLADSPLSLKGSVPPNVMFALSVEFPTALVAAYQGTNDYSPSIEYKGYFDAEKCYRYTSSDLSTSNTGYFIPVGFAVSRACNASGQWSGNFLNWATMSGLDEFRYAMTGGHRYVDTASETVLERSYQNTQGNYFPNKSITNFGATGTPAALTIANYGKGVQMQVTAAGSDTANCTNPSKTGATWNGCSLALASSGSTGSCTVWSGDGSTATPYRCTTFGAWSGGESFTTATPGTVATGSDSADATVTCSDPTISGGNFNCTLTISGGSTGSCTAWAGTGSSAAPFTCTTFSTFGGNQFNPSSQAPATTFSGSSTTTTTQTDTINRPACTGGGAINTNMTCPLGVAGKTVSCKITTGTGSSSSPFRCGSGTVWSFNDPTYSFNAWTESSSGNKTQYGTKWYRFPNTVGYSISTTVSGTYYYIPSYSGSASNTYKYYSTYTMSLAGTANYNVRVRVCDVSVGQENNCKQFGTAWKPTGVVQDNGDKMRFGVMSYFMKNDIDNAVLRSKLKYVAPQKYSSAGGTVANSAKEWSETDGTLVADPDAADAATHSSFVGTMSHSGVINYINQFGLYPDPSNTSYRYKGLDDIGKLYYETLRYLRGLSPTQAFYQGATAASADGFPVITQWDDPVQYSCQKNYIITLGDQFVWCDKRLPGSTLVNGTGQCNAYTDANGNSHPADGAASGGTVSLNSDTLNVKTETDWVGTTEGMSNLGTTITGAGSSASYFMAGMAAWAAKSDIRPDNAANPATLGKQTVKTFVVNVEENKACGYRSQFWLAAKYGNPASYDASGNWLTTDNPWSTNMVLSANECSSSSFPPPTTTSPSYSVAAGGTVVWPKSLLRASNPTLMIDSVRSAIAQIVGQIGEESALAQSSGSLDTGSGAYIYRATYNSSGWTGNVEALSIDTSGTIASTPAWSAVAKLPVAANRTVLTFNDGQKADGTAETTANSRRGVVFDPASFASNLSSGQQAALNKDEFGTTDGFGVERMSYLRGDQSNEAPNGNAWRARTALLGDFINSNPVYVAAPVAGLPGQGYRTFALANKNRKPMVYVGGNDGMLHGFDASFTIDSATHNPVVTSTSGTELLAYIPSATYRNLSQLMAPGYSHKYFVDGSPTVGEACFGTNCASTADASTDWKTIVVGGLNAGGQGIYALDVTDPTAFAADKVLWEFTDQDDADLGYTFGRPLIRRMNNGRWAVIFGNGYNNSNPDLHASTTGRAYLFIVYVDGPGAGNAWTQGTDYFKIELTSPSEPASPTFPLNPPNGLSAVSGVDTDQNGTVDRLYAGDRNGNVWAVDVSDSDPAEWKAAFGTTSAPLPLFSAKDAATPANAQQITTGIEVGRHPDGGFMVMFGTGSWIDVTDPLSPFKTETLYGVWDKNDNSTRVSGRAVLQQQKVLAYVDADGNACDIATAPAGTCYAIFSNCKPNYSATAATASNSSTLCPASIAYATGTGQQFGWYFDMPGSGERIFSDRPRIAGNVVTFTSVQPATDPCSGNTSGMEYNFAWTSGGAPSSPVYALSNTTGTITISYGGATVSVIPSGMRIGGGASDVGVGFSATPPAGSNSCAPPSGTPSAPAVACVGAACNSAGNTLFIPGWGFLMNLQGPTAGGSRKCLLDCKPPEFGGGLPNCTWMYRQGQAGRISWRQIIR